MPIDYKKYPKNWKAIRNEILERSKNKCECAGECGAVAQLGGAGFMALKGGHALVHKNFSLTPGSVNVLEIECQEKHLQRPIGFNGKRVILTIAHLNHKPKDSRRKNLKAMCQACHLRYDAPMKAANRRALK